MVYRKVTLSREYLVNSTYDEFLKPHERVRADQGGIGVEWHGWSSGLVREEVLVCPHLESPVGWNNLRDRGEVVCQVK